MMVEIPLRGKYCGRFGGRSGGRKTTPNVLRAKARKLRNLQIRQRQDEVEAARLGITIFELQSKRSREGEKIIRHELKTHKALESIMASSRRSRWGF